MYKKQLTGISYQIKGNNSKMEKEVKSEIDVDLDFMALNINKSNQIKQTHYFIYSPIRENIHDTELNYQSFTLI